jgi:di/tricarboxylate transporter
MTLDQSLILAVLAATIVAFLWGRWRHDLVALASLVACVVVGVVPAASAFEGFGDSFAQHRDHFQVCAQWFRLGELQVWMLCARR